MAPVRFSFMVTAAALMLSLLLLCPPGCQTMRQRLSPARGGYERLGMDVRVLSTFDKNDIEKPRPAVAIQIRCAGGYRRCGANGCCRLSEPPPSSCPPGYLFISGRCRNLSWF